MTDERMQPMKRDTQFDLFEYPVVGVRLADHDFTNYPAGYRHGQKVPARSFPGVRSDDPATSRAAYYTAVLDGTEPAMRRRVYDLILGAGGRGMTIGELCRATGAEKSTLSPCIAPMREDRDAVIFDSGETRPGPRTGRPQIVWKAVAVPCARFL